MYLGQQVVVGVVVQGRDGGAGTEPHIDHYISTATISASTTFLSALQVLFVSLGKECAVVGYEDVLPQNGQPVEEAVLSQIPDFALKSAITW